MPLGGAGLVDVGKKLIGHLIQGLVVVSVVAMLVLCSRQFHSICTDKLAREGDKRVLVVFKG